MTETQIVKTDDLISKCVAIQYGILIAGIVLLIVVVFNWYQNYSTRCLADCKKTQQTCRASCRPQPTSAATPVVSPFKAAPKGGKLSDAHIQEHFLSYRADQDPTDFSSYYDTPKTDEDMQYHYDPAVDSLEPSVFDSHREFTDDAYVSTQGPNATNSERDDTNEINPRVGLRRVDYTSIQSGDDARVVSSEYPEQVAQTSDSYLL